MNMLRLLKNIRETVRGVILPDELLPVASSSLLAGRRSWERKAEVVRTSQRQIAPPTLRTVVGEEEDFWPDLHISLC